MKLFRRAVVATAATAAVLTIAPAAHAAKVVHDDAAADVVTWTDPDSGAFQPAPEVTQADILRSVIKHGAYRVNVKLTFTDLRKEGVLAHVLRIRTNEAFRRDLSVLSYAGTYGGEREFTKKNGDEVRCAGLRHEIDYTLNTATFSIPRRCLSAPRWVQVGVGSISTDDLFSETYNVDDARRAGGVNEAGPVWSPRVRKG